MKDTQHSDRWQQASEELGLQNEREERDLDEAYTRELARREGIGDSLSYKLIRTIANVMDRYCLDGFIGLIPGIGDIVSSIFALPFIYVSLFKVRSLRLTLAVIFNQLVDFLLGSITFLGDIGDFFYKSNLQNFKLITGYVDGDEEVIAKVNKRVWIIVIAIVAVLALIYLVLRMIASFISDIISIFIG